MIPEFYMYSADPFDGGESVSGYLCMHHIKDRYMDGYALFMQPRDEPHSLIRIKEDTIKPLRAKPILREVHNGCGVFLHSFPHCPHCNNILDELIKPHICLRCGMAIDWHDFGTS